MVEQQPKPEPEPEPDRKRCSPTLSRSHSLFPNQSPSRSQLRARATPYRLSLPRRSPRSAKCSPASSTCGRSARSLRPQPQPAASAARGRRAAREPFAAVSLGMRPVGRDRLGRGRAARTADRPIARQSRRAQWRGPANPARVRGSRALSRCGADRVRGRTGGGRMEAQRGAGIRAGGRAIRGLSRRCHPLDRDRRAKRSFRQEEEPLDEDALRELIHELRTPLTAIIGFAEIIDGQYLGPAEHSYRERAAEIVCPGASAAFGDRGSRHCRPAPVVGGRHRGLDRPQRLLLKALTPELKERATIRGARLDVALSRTPGDLQPRAGGPRAADAPLLLRADRCRRAA